jgi:hypothetical protein
MSKKAAKKKKKRKKIDHEKEVAQYVSKASVSLGAGLYHARQMNDPDLVKEIFDLAVKSEELESFLTGKHIDRIGKDI